MLVRLLSCSAVAGGSFHGVSVVLACQEPKHTDFVVAAKAIL